MGFLVLAVLIGAATGLALHRVVVGALVGTGIACLGVFILISRASPPE
jgi:hypothetical protein